MQGVDMFGWTVSFSHVDGGGHTWYIKNCPKCGAGYQVTGTDVYFFYCRMCESKFEPVTIESDSCQTCSKFAVCAMAINRKPYHKASECHWNPSQYQRIGGIENGMVD